MTGLRRMLWLLLVVLGCFGGVRVPDAKGGTLLVRADLLDTITWDHGCPNDRIAVLRHNGPRTQVDVDVCGAVRRYKLVYAEPGSANPSSWLDVTALYPSSSLPAAPQR